MAVCSRRRTVVSLDFVSTVLLLYGPHPYSTVFCTAVTVYGTVVSLIQHEVIQWVSQLNDDLSASDKLLIIKLFAQDYAAV